MKKLLLFIFLLYLSHCIAQNKSNEEVIDSISKTIPKLKSNKDLIIAYIKLSLEYSTLDSDKGLFYGQKALELSKKINWNEGKSNSLISIAENNYSQGKYDVAFKNYESALLHSKNNKTIGVIYRGIATVYNSLGDHAKATQYIFDALKISETTKDESEKAKNYNTIGLTYYYTNQTKKALSYFNKSIEINTLLNNKREICKNLQNIGAEYADIYDINNAIIYFNKSLSLAKEIDFKESIALNNFTLGRLYIDNEQLDKGLLYIINSRKYAAQIKNNRIYNSSIITEANIYTKQSFAVSNPEKKILFNKAEKKLLEAIEKARKSNSLINLSSCYKLISDLYTLKNEHKIAKDYYVLRSNIQDSIYNSESKETIKNLEDKRTIDLRNKEIQLNKITLENKEKQKYYFIAGLLLLVVIGCLLFYQSQNRKKTNEKLQVLNTELDEANKAKTRFFSILNHDLRGPVANLIFFLQLQKESPELLDEESIKRMQDKTMSGAENLLNSMEDILQWSKSQMENFKPQPQPFKIASLFDDTKKHFSSEENIKFTFENPSDLSLITDENYLKTIVRNLTGNAVKAMTDSVIPSDIKGQIIWKAFQENSQTFLSITDNGKGATDEQFKVLYDDKEVVGIKTGLGLHLIRDLAKAIDCAISVDSTLNEGTTITLTLK